MRRTLLSTLLIAAPLPAAAQEQVQDHAMHDMAMPQPPAEPAPQADPHAGHHMPQEAQSVTPPFDHSMHDMQGMDGMDAMGDPDAPALGSGTTRLPARQGGMRGVHLTSGDWMVMAHGYAWGVHTDQTGPRGDREAFVASMAMITAQRDFGGASLQLRSMLSLEPLMGARGYPNLFTTGEAANGLPLVDRQHPHDLFMELAARVDVPLSEHVTGFLYGGPVAEPALGPSAFMHRASAKYLSLGPIGHHWFDSTHITYGVVTAGVATRQWQFEGSAFRGREPDERRWDIETPALDSWSVRATWTPSPHWAAQVSHGRLNEPEVMHRGEDEARTTASVHYASKAVNAMLGYALKNRVPGPALSAWVGEANWDLSRHHSLFGRVENVANDELFPDHDDPRHDTKYRVTRFEAGYAYRIPLTGILDLALGSSLSAYAKPDALDSVYGKAPIGYTFFAKLSLGN